MRSSGTRWPCCAARSTPPGPARARSARCGGEAQASRRTCCCPEESLISCALSCLTRLRRLRPATQLEALQRRQEDEARSLREAECQAELAKAQAALRDQLDKAARARKLAERCAGGKTPACWLSVTPWLGT